MKVRATTMVFYNNRRYREGVEFHLQDEKHFTPSCMEKLEANKSAVKKKPTSKDSKEDKSSPTVDQNQKVI